MYTDEQFNKLSVTIDPHIKEHANERAKKAEEYYHNGLVILVIHDPQEKESNLRLPPIEKLIIEELKKNQDRGNNANECIWIEPYKGLTKTEFEDL